MSKKYENQLIRENILYDRRVSPILQATGMDRDWPESRGIWYCKRKEFIVWVNEEDHLRIISMQKGGNIKQVRPYKKLLNKNFHILLYKQNQSTHFSHCKNKVKCTKNYLI